MKLLRQLSKGKLWTTVRDLLPIFMPRKKKMPMLSVGSTVVAKCREFWESLTGCGFAVARQHADDYFKGSYEFSCTATPINVLAKSTNGRGRRGWRLMPPCICGKQAQEMLESIAPAKGWSPERALGDGAGNEIDGLAEEFIRRFHEQLRMQRMEELQVEH
ncbi:hypothetical protein HU200_043534 [Digitaria exilis]|uniref:Uncharacterized protein n=1 Tax=Digitaria exilis TaxID=1010633 RepID=A0A835EF07_9POAL|nr:hypothetical protein HU200_043534 [Digitaria exilis]CAB3446729.1 unnamed protein product [Digitaria exilis]